MGGRYVEVVVYERRVEKAEDLDASRQALAKLAEHLRPKKAAA